MTKEDLLYLQIKPRLVDFLKAAGVPLWEPALTVCPHCGGHAEILMDFMWHCPSCNKRGDVVDYITVMENLKTKWAAIKRICRTLQIKVTALEVVSADELLEKKFENKEPLICGFIGRGLYLMCGAPKTGKSWLALWLAHRVSLGEDIWEFKSNQCEVLYIDLEDTYQRIQNRLVKVTGGNNGNIFFATDAELIGNGLEEQIKGFLVEHPSVKFIIIDTLQKVRQLRAEQYSYAGDYETLSQLKSLADRFGITIILVHHTRKAKSADPLDAVSGTTGITGAADGILVLMKDDRSAREATLFVTGRDVVDMKLRIMFDADTRIWKLCGFGDFEEDKCGRLFGVLCSLLDEKGTYCGTATALLSVLLEYDEIDISSSNALTRMLNAHKYALEHDYGIFYSTSRSANERLIHLTRADDIFQN